MPQTSASVSFEIYPSNQGSNAEYDSKERRISWVVRKLVGGTEWNLKAKINLASPLNNNINNNCVLNPRLLIGAISCTFEIPMYNLSKMQVQYLRIADQSKTSNPQRWVRYLTQSNSYVCRMTS